MYAFFQTSLLFNYFTKVNKFGILGKFLPSGTWLYTFSLKRQKCCCKKWQWVFSTFHLKELQSGSIASFSFFWLRIQNFCFKSENISRAFDAGLGAVVTFTMFTKTREFQQKAGGFIMLLNFTLHKNLLLPKTIQFNFDFP